MNLEALLTQAEGKILELKRDLSSHDPILRTVVAFANTSGGTLIIGVDDGTRAVRGVADPLEAEERLANLIADCIEPRLVPNIEVVAWRKTHLLVAEVYPSSQRPHQLKRLGLERGVFVRVGSTNRLADAALIAEMRRVVLGRTYDEEPLIEAKTEDLDLRVASELFASVRPLKAADLQTLHLVADYQGRTVPTVGGMLLFGADRQRYFPDAWVQCGRFEGTDKSRILDHTECYEILPRAALSAVEFVKKHAFRGAQIGEGRRKDLWSIPLVAVREAVVNAVVHADYSHSGSPVRVAVFDDRIEIDSPGILPFGVTLADMQRGVSKLRNRVLGRVFRELGLIEQWGSGIQRMLGDCSRNSLPEPGFEEMASQFRVTIWTRPVRPHQADKSDAKILSVLADGSGRATSDIARMIGVSARTTRTRLRGLEDRGLVVAVGKSVKDPHRKYYLPKRTQD